MPPKNVNELLSTEYEKSALSSVSVVASNSCHGANESMTQKPVARPNSQASLPENLGSYPGSKLNTHLQEQHRPYSACRRIHR